MRALRPLAVLCLGLACSSAGAEPPGHVTGIGGVFFKAKDPKALAAWYRDALGLPLQSWGGAMLRYDAPQHPDVAAWRTFPATTNYFAPSASDFMIDYAVDDMDAILARVTAKGGTIVKRSDDDPSGRFAWILDPENNKVELWQPRAGSGH